MSFTPYNAPLLSSLLGDMEIARFFSVAEDCKAMLQFEAALAKAEARCGVIPQDAAEAIARTCAEFEPDVHSLSASAERDGLVVPELIRQLREAVGEPHAQHVHFGATSQDVIDTSVVMRLQGVFDVFQSRMAALDEALDAVLATHGNKPLMGRTRMQAALPLLVSDRVNSWKVPLAGQITRLAALQEEARMLQFGGAVGTLEKLAANGPAVREALAGELHLRAPEHNWHSDRRIICDIGNWFSMTSGLLGKLGQDIALMAQNGIDEIIIGGAGGSSAMAHKKNPVKAEALVTCARFNAVQISGLHHALIHEQERSGAAWMLEWMIIPQMAVVTGAALRNAAALVQGIEEIGTIPS